MGEEITNTNSNTKSTIIIIILIVITITTIINVIITEKIRKDRKNMNIQSKELDEEKEREKGIPSPMQILPRWSDNSWIEKLKDIDPKNSQNKKSDQETDTYITILGLNKNKEIL